MTINITVDQIMAWAPCRKYDRQRVEELWGERAALTPQEIAGLPIPAGDRVWALARPEIMGERAYQEWGYECAARVLPLWEAWAAENCPRFRRVPREALDAAKRGMKNGKNTTQASAEAAARAAVEFLSRRIWAATEAERPHGAAWAIERAARAAAEAAAECVALRIYSAAEAAAEAAAWDMLASTQPQLLAACVVLSDDRAAWSAVWDTINIARDIERVWQLDRAIQQLLQYLSWPDRRQT